MRPSPRPLPARFVVFALAVVVCALTPGVIARANEESSPKMPAAPAAAAVRKPAIDLALPEKVATATFALG